MAISFIELFAGIGGFRLACEQAGATCLFASEWDRHACRTYHGNHGDVPSGDITRIAADDIPDHTILTAGFPCQPFSTQGVTKSNSLGRKHGFEHPTQGTMFFEIVRVLAAKHPPVFLLENVKHLRTHNNGNTFAVIMQTLQEHLGYTVFVATIDARTVVPQHRERLYFVGFRTPHGFQFPQMPDYAPRLGDIIEPQVLDKYTLSDRQWQYMQAYAQKHRARGNGFGYGLADLDGVTRTLMARYYKDGSEILVPQPGKNPRRLTPRECARLMGYPDTFQLLCRDSQMYRQFGNSVVVPVVYQLVQSIIATISQREQ